MCKRRKHMTLSEKICQDINRKFYFDDFVLNNLYYWKDGIKMEICDGLIEFEDRYIIIQIKERDSQESTNNQKWLERKVYKKATSQIKDTIEIIKMTDNLIVEDLYGQQVNIDKTKSILPIIVFKNDEITEYKRVYHSSTKNININIFSENDYKTMMEKIEVPCEIIDYLMLRQELFQHSNFNVILDDSENGYFMMANIENELDVAEYFLMKTIKDKPYNKLDVKNFLGIIQKYNLKRINQTQDYKQILYRMLRFDRFGASYFMQRWNNCWDLSKKRIFNCQQIIVGQNISERFGFLFISAKKDDVKDNNKFYSHLTNLFIQKYQLQTAIAIISYYEGNNNYLVNWLFMSKPFENDEELQKVLDNNDLWKHTKQVDSN